MVSPTLGKGLSFVSDLGDVARAVAGVVADTERTDPYTVLHSGEAIPSPTAIPAANLAPTEISSATAAPGGAQAVLLGSNGMMGPPGAAAPSLIARRRSPIS